MGNNNFKALILAGGRGTRLRPLTHTNNKHALLIGNRPMIMYPFLSAVDAGIEDIAIIVNETRAEIESILGDGSKWGVKVDYLYQDNPGGLAHALSLAEDYMAGSRFVMILGDNLIQESLAPHVKYFNDNHLDGLVLGITVPVSEHPRCGMATINQADNTVVRYVEKPGVVDMSPLYNPESSYAMTGFYFFDSKVFACFKGEEKIVPSSRGELEIAAPYNWLIEHGYKVGFQEVKGWWKDPGKPSDLLSANQIVLEWRDDLKQEGEVENSTIEGKVEIKAGSHIKNAKVIGPVSIGGNVVIDNAVIGPNVSIGDNTHIENVRISNSIILGNSKLKNINTQLDNCLIGWDVEVYENQEQEPKSSLFIGDNSIVTL